MTVASTSTQENATSCAESYLLVLPSLPTLVVQALPWLSTQWTKLDQAQLEGYQVWAVEQRVTDRTALLPVIIVATGIDEHVITVDRYQLNAALHLTPDQHRQAWNKAKSLLKASNARLANTHLGSVPVTALPSLAAMNLSLIQLPDTVDYASVMDVLYQNINLRRLGMGARSSLSFAPATYPQLLHFRQTFHLPTPTPRSHSLPSTITSTSTLSQPSPNYIIIDLLKLVQHALSLFNLGPVYTPSPRGTSTTTTTTTDDPERPLRNREGDGLLCDTTLSALFKFRKEFASPFLGMMNSKTSGSTGSSLENDNQTGGTELILTSKLLAVLLSLSLATRTRMVLQGAQNVPKDPFEKRRKFVRSVAAFKKEYRIEEEGEPNGWITTVFLERLRREGRKGRGKEGETTGRSKVVGKVLSVVPRVGVGKGGDMHDEDQEYGSIKDDSHSRDHRVLKRRLHKPRIGALETTELEALVEHMKNDSVGGVSTARLWDLTRNRKERREEERERKREEVEEGSATDGIGATGGGAGGGTTSGEGEIFGFGKGVLKGVRQRAGRAVGKIGDGLGFNDANSAAAGNHGKETPSVVISAPAGYELRHSSTGDSASLNSQSFASRIASALTTEHTMNPLPSVVRNRFTNSHSPPAAVRLSNSPATSGNGSIKSREKEDGGIMLPSSLRSENSSVVHLGVGTLDLKLPRRTVSVSNMGHEGNAQSSSLGMGKWYGMTDDDEEEEAIKRDEQGSRRRHSFHTLSTLEEPFQHLSRRRLALDVELRYVAWSLKRKEKNLLNLKMALRNVLEAYEKAVEQVEKGDQVEVADELVERSEALLDRFDWFTRSKSSTLGELVDSTKEALYGADRLRKRVDEIESMEVSLADSLGKKKVGEGMRTGKSGLEDLVEKARAQTGGLMKKVVQRLERWGVDGWLEWFRDELDVPARIGEDVMGSEQDEGGSQVEDGGLKGEMVRLLDEGGTD